MIAVRLSDSDLKRLTEITELFSSEDEFEYTISEVIRELIQQTWEKSCQMKTKNT